MAAVYLARDERLDRLVAVKRMHTSGGDEMDARRFEREAKLGASLSHPNLVSIFDTEQDEESVLIVMEYVEGETLAELLGRGAVEPRRAVEIVRAVADALDHALSSGIVHRDIKPGNVLLGKDGSVKLADLGIAKAVERTEITGTGTVLGTPAYMAPEQLEGGELGPAVDIYALATMTYEMLTGKKARRGRTAVEIAHQVVNEPPPDPRDAGSDIPAPAAHAIRAGMSRDSSERPGSAGELADQLERCFDGQPEKPREEARTVAAVTQPTRREPPTPPRRTAVTTSRRRAPSWVLAVGGLFALALAAVVIGLSSGGGADEDRASEKPAKQDKERSDGNSAAPAEEAPAEEVPAEETPAAPAAGGVPQPAGEGGTAEAHRLHLAGHEALEAGDYDTAIELNTQAIRAFPPGTTWQDDIQYAYALFSLGKALNGAGRHEEAVAVLEERAAVPDQQATVQQELAAAKAAAGE